MSTSSETPGVLPLLPEVKASEQEVRAIVDAIPHAISVFGPDGAVLYVNRAFREFSGFTMEDVMASDFRARLSMGGIVIVTLLQGIWIFLVVAHLLRGGAVGGAP